MMANIAQKIKMAATGLLLVAGISSAGVADILIIDDERVEREAAAYKDFNLQTNQIREAILQLRNRLARGGTFEQALADFEARQKAAKADLDQRKSIIGDTKYKEELAAKEVEFQQEGLNLNRNYQTETDQLSRLELVFDRLRQEAQTQVERARQPVLRNILKERGAKIIMRKRLVMGSASGLDVTTEFIEQLDDTLPTVTLTLLQQPAAANDGAPAEVPVAEDGGGQ